MCWTWTKTHLSCMLLWILDSGLNVRQFLCSPVSELFRAQFIDVHRW
jgi:hypothetical protein